MRRDDIVKLFKSALCKHCAARAEDGPILNNVRGTIFYPVHTILLLLLLLLPTDLMMYCYFQDIG